MVSGIPTASGYEERIRFSEMEVVDRQASENGLVHNLPQGHEINGWDVNVAGVRTMSIKKHLRYHTHAVIFIQRTESKNDSNYLTGVSDTCEATWRKRDLRWSQVSRLCTDAQEA